MKKSFKIAALVVTAVLSCGVSAHELNTNYQVITVSKICNAIPLTCNIFPDGDGFGSGMPKDPPKK